MARRKKTLVIRSAAFDELRDLIIARGWELDFMPLDEGNEVIEFAELRLERKGRKKANRPKPPPLDADPYECLACGETVRGQGNFTCHVRDVHGLTRKEYYLKYVSAEVPICRYCPNEVGWHKLKHRWAEVCSNTACLSQAIAASQNNKSSVNRDAGSRIR